MAVYRFAARSLRPGEFALASVTSSIVPNVIRAYTPRRPARFGLNADVLFSPVFRRPLSIVPASDAGFVHCYRILSDIFHKNCIFICIFRFFVVPLSPNITNL